MSLLMLLAPKTLCTHANLCGSDEGKYGAKTHSGGHRRRRNLHAAHGAVDEGDPPCLPAALPSATATTTSVMLAVARAPSSSSSACVRCRRRVQDRRRRWKQRSARARRWLLYVQAYPGRRQVASEAFMRRSRRGSGEKVVTRRSRMKIEDDRDRAAAVLYCPTRHTAAPACRHCLSCRLTFD
jgi:hypothetical protein